MTTTLNYASKLLFGAELSSDLPALPGSGTKLLQVDDAGNVTLGDPVSSSGSANAVQVANGSGGFADSGLTGSSSTLGGSGTGGIKLGPGGILSFQFSGNNRAGFQTNERRLDFTSLGGIGWSADANNYQALAVDTQLKRAGVGIAGMYAADGTTLATLYARNLLVPDDVLTIGRSANAQIEISASNIRFGKSTDSDYYGEMNNNRWECPMPLENLSAELTLGSTATGAIVAALSLSADPTAIDIPDGFSALVKNTTSGEARHWYNDGGVLKKSAAYT